MDEAKLNEFMGKLVVDMGGAAIMANVILGEELGLYRAHGRRQAGDAGATGRAHRLQRPAGARVAQRARPRAATSNTTQGRFRLPDRAGHGAGARGLAGLRGRRRGRAGQHVPRQGQAGRRHARRRRAVVGRPPSRACSPAPSASSGPAIAPTWSPTWLPALDGVVPRLEQGAKVADIGCGHGASTVIMAQAYPEVDLPRLRLSRPVDRAGAPARGGRRRRRPGAVHAGDRQEFPGQRLRPGVLLRLPARHGRPGGRGPARARGAEAGRHGAAGRALRQRRPGRQPQPGGPPVLRRVDLHLHAQLAVAGGRAGAGRAGGRSAAAARLRRGRLLAASAAPPRRRSTWCWRRASRHPGRQPRPGRGPRSRWSCSSPTAEDTFELNALMYGARGTIDPATGPSNGVPLRDQSLRLAPPDELPLGVAAASLKERISSPRSSPWSAVPVLERLGGPGSVGLMAVESADNRRRGRRPMTPAAPGVAER